MKSKNLDKFKKLPGYDLVFRGINDIQKDRHHTIYALLIYLALPHFEKLGFKFPHTPENPNILLYEKLSKKFGNDAHYQFNALQQRMFSFCNCL